MSSNLRRFFTDAFPVGFSVRKLFLLIFVLTIFSQTVCADDSQNTVQNPKKQGPKNVILMIGDGMGFNADLAGTYWRFGKEKAQSYHQFPQCVGVSTFAITSKSYDETKEKGYQPEVFWSSLSGNKKGDAHTTVTDSAAAATVLNSGVKTLGGRIGMDIDKKTVELSSEIAKKTGRSAGVVTTVTIPHATPAGAAVHNESRNNYLEISRAMILDTDLEVIFGGGNPDYNGACVLQDNDPKDRNYSYVGGQSIWNELKKNRGFAGINLIESKEQFEELAEKGVQNKDADVSRYFGAVRCGDYIPPVDGADLGTKGEKLLKDSLPAASFAEVPTLTTMSKAALNILAQNENGFYLMIEGGAIDSANHARDINRMVLEHEGFTKAIDAVIEWVETNSSWDETLLIITADHETGQIWGPNTYVDAVQEEKNAETGEMVEVKKNGLYDEGETFNGFQKVVNNGQRAVPGVQYAYGSHTNALVPLWAKGNGCENIEKMIRGTDEKAAAQWDFSGKFIDNTDVFRLVKLALLSDAE